MMEPRSYPYRRTCRLRRATTVAAVALLLLSSACKTTTADPAAGSQPPTSGDRPECHVVFDAGSSGTRLHVYEAGPDATWIDHEGPQAGALADPVREQRGKTWADADTVAQEVAGLLPQMQADFDWAAQCRVGSASVLATAGMRLAENDAPDRAAQMYDKVEAALGTVLAEAGVQTEIEARTLTGFEEGLFAWLALPGGPSTSLALVEMGGASTQIAFACPNCPDTQRVRVDGQTVAFYGYSILGLGTDEAPTTVAGGVDPHCSYGVGLETKGWKPADCEATMTIREAEGIIDPYNYGPEGRGIHVDPPIEHFDGDWRLTGAFPYWKAEDVDGCCMQRGECYQPPTSCFRTLYLPQYLGAVGIPDTATPADTSWTLGAVMCRAQDCLADLEAPLPCRWRADGCAP